MFDLLLSYAINVNTDNIIHQVGISVTDNRLLIEGLGLFLMRNPIDSCTFAVYTLPFTIRSSFGTIV